MDLSLSIMIQMITTMVPVREDRVDLSREVTSVHGLPDVPVREDRVDLSNAYDQDMTLFRSLSVRTGWI